MTTNELLRHFANASFRLTRDLLYFWERRGWIKPLRVRENRKTLDRRIYPQSEIEKISILLNCYADGLTPEKAFEMAQTPQLLRGRHLTNLLDATNALNTGSLLGDRDQVLDLVAQALYKVLNCECAAILLFPPTADASHNPILPPRRPEDGLFSDPRSSIDLVAAWGDKPHSKKPRSFRLHDDLHGGLTGWVIRSGGYQGLQTAFDGQCAWQPGVSLFGPELRNHPYRSDKPPDHLFSGVCHSLLMRPLIDRKRRIVGWVKVENRKGADGRPSDVMFFDPVDQAILESLCIQIVTTLENMAVVGASTFLLKAVMATSSLQEYCAHMVKQAVTLLGADRGDVAWAFGRDLRVLAHCGPSQKKIGDALPRRSLSFKVLEMGLHLRVDRVEDFPEYECCWAATRSELLVPLTLDRRVLGVLNVESNNPDFFDARDVDVLHYLAHHVVPAAELVESRDTIYARLVERTPTPHQKPIYPENGDAALISVLDSVRRGTGLDGGIVYVADFQLGKLRCAASIPHRVVLFSHDFEGTSLAAEVFRRKDAIFISEPKKDPRVDPRGLDIFDIRGPLVGAPLLFGSTVVGVLVLWGIESRDAEASDLLLVQQHTHLAVTTTAISEVGEKMGEMVKDVNQVLSLVQANADRSDVIRLILATLLKLGFDRARVFSYDSNDQAFVCLDSVGREQAGVLSGRTIALKESHYAKLTYDNWRSGNMRPSIRSPHLTGPDPSAAMLYKPADLPWIVSPLAVGDLFGYLAVDNAVSRREFTTEDLEIIGLFSSLAANALAAGQLRREPQGVERH